ncbi:hypothetical protein H6P81_009114 [Aristolochia fimbriata]|uniref:Uncharacterized protein n=1 Tax=Aristolochia fimbriata TaxID=158543 RepID=A0AAV7EKJ1_ARIFI|nr:hypothetical protein H6P81_009114 [Aristolochia fimbriata]
MKLAPLPPQTSRMKSSHKLPIVVESSTLSAAPSLTRKASRFFSEPTAKYLNREVEELILTHKQITIQYSNPPLGRSPVGPTSKTLPCDVIVLHVLVAAHLRVPTLKHVWEPSRKTRLANGCTPIVIDHREFWLLTRAEHSHMPADTAPSSITCYPWPPL